MFNFLTAFCVRKILQHLNFPHLRYIVERVVTLWVWPDTRMSTSNCLWSWDSFGKEKASRRGGGGGRGVYILIHFTTFKRKVAYKRAWPGHEPRMCLIIFKRWLHVHMIYLGFSGYIHYNLLSFDKICQ